MRLRSSFGSRVRYAIKLSRQLLAEARAVGEIGRLVNQHPHLAGLEQRMLAYRGELAATRGSYTRDVSSDAMALSLQTAALVASLTELLKPARALDLGSGYSSFVTRSVGATECWSVDDSPEWLERTVGLLASRGLSTEHCLHWEEFEARSGERFDLVVHDLGDVRQGPAKHASQALRETAFPAVLDAVSPRGWLVIDDIHISGYRQRCRRLLEARGFSVFRLTRETIDSHGRYAWLAFREEE